MSSGQASSSEEWLRCDVSDVTPRGSQWSQWSPGPLQVLSVGESVLSGDFMMMINSVSSSYSKDGLNFHKCHHPSSRIVQWGQQTHIPDKMLPFPKITS